jgi:hypothetical protein
MAVQLARKRWYVLSGVAVTLFAGMMAIVFTHHGPYVRHPVLSAVAACVAIAGIVRVVSTGNSGAEC